MSAPQTIEELRRQILADKGRPVPVLRIAPRAANYLAGKRLTTVEMRDVLDMIVEVSMVFAFVEFAQHLRVTEHELQQALEDAGGHMPTMRAEMMAQLAMHGARHRAVRNESCRFCAPEFQQDVEARAAKGSA